MDRPRGDFPESINTDIAPQSLGAGATATGATQALSAGQLIRLQYRATQNATVIVETPSDGGSTWPNSFSEVVPGVTGEDNFHAVFTPVGGANRYRVRVTMGSVPGHIRCAISQARA
ncbi:hypothetical protein [Piscinibacterium candidicorallinum]|uniref:Uncharacterized protein n=1 Tax=Piscinibacterium candidicorallinum TaxID=1793872 RepID=A0ABV7GYH8_9BURK